MLARLVTYSSRGGIPYHSCHTPYISASTPFGTQNHFGRSILSRLNVVGKVVVDPASIAQICNLDADNVEGVRIFRLALVTCRGRG